MSEEPNFEMAELYVVTYTFDDSSTPSSTDLLLFDEASSYRRLSCARLLC